MGSRYHYPGAPPTSPSTVTIVKETIIQMAQFRPPTNPRGERRDRAGRLSRRPVQVIAAGARAVVGVRAADLPVHPWEQPEPRRVLVNGALPLRRAEIIRTPEHVVVKPSHRPVARRRFRGFAAAARRALQEAGLGAGVAVRAGRTRPGRRPSPRPNQLPNQLPSPSPSPRPSRRPIRRPSRLGRRPNPRLLGSRR